MSLNLKETHFDHDFKEPMATLRLLHYSKKQSRPELGVYACRAHSDYGIATLLLTDDKPGLQIYNNNYNNNKSSTVEEEDEVEKWIDVPPRPNSFAVNIGDLFEIWTNGQYKSTIHRVLTTTTTTTADDDDNDESCAIMDRYSIPFFFDPSFETVVRCLETCCTDSTRNNNNNNPPK